MASYPIPPWLNPPSGEAAGAARLQARSQADRIALEREKMRQDYELSAMQAQLRSEALASEILREQHKIEIGKAYQDAQLGLREQQLQQNQQRIDLATTQAARRYSAQQQYQSRVQAGENPQQVLMELGPLMSGGGLGGMGSIVGAPRDMVQPEIFEDIKGLPSHIGARTGRGSIQYIPKPGAKGPLEAKPIPGTTDYLDIGGKAFRIPTRKEPSDIIALRNEIDTLQQTIARAGDKAKPATIQRAEMLKKQLEERLKEWRAENQSPMTSAPATNTGGLKIIGRRRTE